MDKPRFLNITNDDVLWVYDAAPTEEIPDVDAGPWFEKIMGPDCDCKRPGGDESMIVFPARYGEPADNIQYAGICGTRLILSSKYSLPVEFLEWRKSRLQDKHVSATEWSEFLFETANKQNFIDGSNDGQAAIRAQRQAFWNGCEASLGQQPRANKGIDFIYLPEEKLMYIHLELGTDEAFAKQFMDATTDHENFAAWLKNGTTIERKHSIMQNGQTPQLMQNFSMDNLTIQFKHPLLQRDITTDPNCPPGCRFLGACSLVACTIINFDQVNGTAEVGMEAVAEKSYCDCSG